MAWQRRLISGGYWASTFCEGAARILIPVYFASIGVSATKIGFLFLAFELAGRVVQPVAGTLLRSPIQIGRVTLKEAWRYESTISLSTVLLMAVPASLLFGGMEPDLLVVLVTLYNVLAGFATAPHNDLHITYARSHRASVDIAYYKTVSQLGKTAAVAVSGVLYNAFGMEGCLTAAIASLAISAALGGYLARHTGAAPVARPLRAVEGT